MTTELNNPGGEIKIADISEFNPVKTFECGQCFRWNADACGVYTGVAYDRAAQLRQDGSDVYITCSAQDYDEIWRDYFDLSRDYKQIREKLRISDFMHCAESFSAGIRVLHQQPWETLCSYILSQNNNIPRIKKLVDALCRKFGEQISFNGKTLYTFPSAVRLAALSEDDLAPIRLGYRAAYILSAAKAVAGGALDLDALSSLNPDKARLKLKQLRGVGDKVADCMLLYGLHMLDSFPVDVWIKRALEQHFEPGFDPSVFSPYAGAAQLYMFYYIRCSSSESDYK